MPKIKTNRGAAKRFKRTATGKFTHDPAFASHILTKKSPKRKRNLRKDATSSPADTRRLNRMLPYA
ncbi:MAG: 50S ribosomal protein L35 [Pseudomonadota bacterium]